MRNWILAAGVLAGAIAAGALADDARKTVTLEVYLPEGARLLIEGYQTKSTGTMRRFVSGPLPPGKYTYTVTAIVAGPGGPQAVTRRIDVRPGDFESIDLRPPGERPIADVEYEPTPQKVVDALLRLAKVNSQDVLWDLGSGDGRIPVTAAEQYGCQARGFDIDPELVEASRAARESTAWSGWRRSKSATFSRSTCAGGRASWCSTCCRTSTPGCSRSFASCRRARASFRWRIGWPTSRPTSRWWSKRSRGSSTCTCGRPRRCAAVAGISSRGDSPLCRSASLSRADGAKRATLRRASGVRPRASPRSTARPCRSGRL